MGAMDSNQSGSPIIRRSDCFFGAHHGGETKGFSMASTGIKTGLDTVKTGCSVGDEVGCGSAGAWIEPCVAPVR